VRSRLPTSGARSPATPATPLTRRCAPAAYQKAVKEQRLALELASATRERDFYLKQVEQGKAIDAMAAKQQRRAQAAAEEAGGAGDTRGAQEPPKAKACGARVVRTFQQVRLSWMALRLALAGLTCCIARRGLCKPRPLRRGCRRAYWRKCSARGRRRSAATTPPLAGPRLGRARSKERKPRSELRTLHARALKQNNNIRRDERAKSVAETHFKVERVRRCVCF